MRPFCQYIFLYYSSRSARLSIVILHALYYSLQRYFEIKWKQIHFISDWNIYFIMETFKCLPLFQNFHISKCTTYFHRSFSKNLFRLNDRYLLNNYKLARLLSFHIYANKILLIETRKESLIHWNIEIYISNSQQAYIIQQISRDDPVKPHRRDLKLHLWEVKFCRRDIKPNLKCALLVILDDPLIHIVEMDINFIIWKFAGHHYQPIVSVVTDVQKKDHTIIVVLYYISRW
jgi:hypothetical protein